MLSVTKSLQKITSEEFAKLSEGKVVADAFLGRWADEFTLTSPGQFDYVLHNLGSEKVETFAPGMKRSPALKVIFSHPPQDRIHVSLYALADESAGNYHRIANESGVELEELQSFYLRLNSSDL